MAQKKLSKAQLQALEQINHNLGVSFVDLRIPARTLTWLCEHGLIEQDLQPATYTLTNDGYVALVTAHVAAATSAAPVPSASAKGEGE